MNARCAPPFIVAPLPRGERQQRVELLPGPFELSGSRQLGLEALPQFDEQLDIKGRLAQLVWRERPERPVCRPVALLEDLAELGFDECCESDSLAPEQPAGELGVE